MTFLVGARPFLHPLADRFAPVLRERAAEESLIDVSAGRLEKPDAFAHNMHAAQAGGDEPPLRANMDAVHVQALGGDGRRVIENEPIQREGCAV